ncbi:MAG: multidrug ABC transporter ATPase [Microbacterium sp.]|uniref:multidrug ABC transporter ATPase n=1 Tax=Microbacterium sp. TaxID=51671 RepID=UPI002629164A|nr:multidrug ABC transporter ATPase [Microbacterium sp.]MCX6503478.1 multidrug ABC transporter ATPase [Microbacterium sp.]
MSKTSNGDVPIQRLDRVLATMSLGLLVLSVGCFFAIMIGSSAGADFATGVWPAVSIIVYYAPILAFVMMFTVIIRAFVRRARANRAR